jgi:hypothetical protein
MFERYARNIDPKEERFQAFISKYIADKGITNIRAVPYVQLYKIIKKEIREYCARRDQWRGNQNESTK